MGGVDANCSCPYDWGGYCKHIVAVLLAYLHEPEKVTERPSVDELLADLGRDDRSYESKSSVEEARQKGRSMEAAWGNLRLVH